LFASLTKPQRTIKKHHHTTCPTLFSIRLTRPIKKPPQIAFSPPQNIEPNNDRSTLKSVYNNLIAFSHPWLSSTAKDKKTPTFLS